MSRNISEKPSQTTTNPPITYNHTLTSPAKSISTNKDGTQCVVGGRNLCSVFHIEEKQFSERCNLVRHRKLNYSITDVQWHPTEENLIASAAGNGAVILWDLTKENNKQEQTLFQQHRFVNRLCFHPSDALLLSCSQDGYMHCIDIRAKNYKTPFYGKTEYIRDVQFHPTEKHMFCAVCESGNVQLWDIRKTDTYTTQFTAHIEPIFTLDWHPEEKNWLATGGRDKSIKIWDTSQTCTHPTHIIHTISSVHKIKWRPGYKFYIASCALVLDNNINIWDIRRPYVPYASFQEHTNAATGIVWQKDSDVILSCSEDKTIYHHVMDDADRPLENAPLVALGLSPRGVIGHAFPNSISKPPPQKSNGLGTRLSNTLPHSTSSTAIVLTAGGGGATTKKSQRKSEFKPDTSTLSLHDGTDWLDENRIGKLARCYKFSGKSFNELCEHNSSVANELELYDKAQTWLILKQLYASANITQQNSSMPLLPSPQSSTSKLHMMRSNDGYLNKIDSPEIFTDGIGVESLSSDEEILGLTTGNGILRHNQRGEMAVVEPELDAVFGDDDYSTYFPAEIVQDEDDLESLPSEAFQLRQSFGDSKVTVPSDHLTLDETTEPVKLPTFEVPAWEYKGLVKDMLYHYAEQGDVQMCVTVLLTLKDIGREMVDLVVQKEWFLGYLEILSRLRLFNVATEIMNQAPEPVNQDSTLSNLSNLSNNSSTTVYIQCDTCNKKLEHSKPGWYCHQCSKICQLCSICHIPVKGLYVWCQGCAHGGHLQHFKEWFENNSLCPAGCGHKCEYS